MVIFVKITIVFQVLPNFRQDFLQFCAVLTVLNNISVATAANYSPLRHNITNADFLNYFSTFSNNFIVCGDFNAKHQSWSCRANNPRSFTLCNLTHLKQFKVLAPPSPIFWPTSRRKIPDTLNIFATKILSNIYCAIHNFFDLISDHSSILLALHVYPPIYHRTPKLFNATTDRYKFHDLVNQEIKLKFLDERRQCGKQPY